MNLKSKMLHGSFWSFVEKGGQQVLSLLVFLILARILGPEDYGTANVCFIFFSLTTMVTNGLVDGIVSNQIEDDLRLSNLFWGINLIGLIISFLCFCLAKPFSLLMDTSQLEGLLIWFSVVPALASLTAIPNLLLLKELDFRVYAIRSIASTLAGGAVGIYMALNEFGAYAIVGQQITILSLNNLIVWLSVDWRPKAAFNQSIFLNEIRSGVAVASVNVLSFLNEQLPRFFIATILGPTSLGFYALATRLRFSLTEMLINSPLNVIYPAIAKLNHDKVKQHKITSLVIYLCGLVTFPILTIGIVTADLYIPLFFGDRWIKTIPILQICLCITMVAPFIVITQQIFRAHNEMWIFLRVRMYLLLLSISTISLLFFENGLVLMTLALLLLCIISAIIYIWLLEKTIQIDLKQDLKQLHMPILGCIFICLVSTYLQKNIGINWSELRLLICSVTLGLISYSVFCFTLSKEKILMTIRLITSRE